MRDQGVKLSANLVEKSHEENLNTDEVRDDQVKYALGTITDNEKHIVLFTTKKLHKIESGLDNNQTKNILTTS